MLSLEKISKDYYIGKKNTETFQVVHALKEVSIKFRKCEFVSILGQSGCGKTTLLNVIGGLDHYTSGDLKINGVSTKEFKDRDWDNYRNHSIGFIFQSYNLIPHQNVLENVELALTLNGVNKNERKKRTIEALEMVGLGDKIYSKPNQLSGGQMQRVAIARALINNPDIILADEPTGALDSETSVQVMELLKKISEKKLIIMVTHNPNLAKKYSTRIIELFDGSIKSDSNPVRVLPPIRKSKKSKIKNPHMSFTTALGLSIKNLLTKKARTSLVSFAGSIGIIGIALVLSMSSGFQGYIDRVQEETLSSYPISITSQTNDLSSLMEMFMDIDKDVDHEMDAVYSNNIMSKIRDSMINSIRINNLKDFKTFLDNDERAKEVITKENVKYYYGLDLQIYKSDDHRNLLSTNLMSNNMVNAMMNSNTTTWAQMIDNDDLINRQYDVVYGKMPSNYDEVVIILDENNEIPDMTLYSLGLLTSEQYEELLNNGDLPPIKISYEDIVKHKYVVFPNSDYYVLGENRAINKRGDLDYMESIFNDENRVINLNISGIIRPKEETVGTVLQGAIGYKSQLVEEMVKRINDSEVVKYQFAHQDIDIFSGNTFENKEYNKDSILVYLASLIDDENNKNTYASYIYDGLGDYYMSLFAGEEETVKGNLAQLLIYMGTSSNIEEATVLANQLYQIYKFATVNDAAKDAFIEAMIRTSLKTELDNYYDLASYKDNLRILGVCDLDTPTRVDLYAYDFANKEAIVSLIDEYNDEVTKVLNKEENVINYTDYVGLMMSSVSTIIDIISIVLIVFVSISLVVSSIMIGVITYISVLERIKEIGILRALGASKKDIKRVFTAESITIGFLAGAVGILITVIIIIPANMILKVLTGISGLAHLPLLGALILIGISVLMTFIAGLLPANIASKKDPVVALRTE